MIKKTLSLNRMLHWWVVADPAREERDAHKHQESLAGSVNRSGIVCGATSTAQAQPSVTGRVLTVDGEPVPVVRVEFSAPESRQRWVAISDTDGRYAVRLGAPVTAVGEEQGTQLPKTARLGQNYPNPFNPSTVIEFDVLEPGPVRLGVYNLLGQPVKTLVDDWHSAGSYRVSWMAETGRVRAWPPASTSMC